VACPNSRAAGREASMSIQGWRLIRTHPCRPAPTSVGSEPFDGWLFLHALPLAARCLGLTRSLDTPLQRPLNYSKLHLNFRLNVLPLLVFTMSAPQHSKMLGSTLSEPHTVPDSVQRLKLAIPMILLCQTLPLI